MHKFVLLFLLFSLVPFLVYAHEHNDEAENLVIEYGYGNSEIPEIKQLTAEEDDLYSGAEIKDLEKTLSAEEKQQENSTGLDYMAKSEESVDIACDDARLADRVKEFIYKNISKGGSNSVLEKRKRSLLIKNLHGFEEINDGDELLKENFEASAALIQLKVNENRKISRICVSKGNNSKRFSNVFAIIYPYINYNKVIVPNLLVNTEKLDEATFVFAW